MKLIADSWIRSIAWPLCDSRATCVYIGENVLHMAIVNEDPDMVKFLLDRAAEVPLATNSIEKL